MVMVDPEKDSSSGRPKAGWHTAAAVGYRRWTATTKTPMISMGFVILAGPDQGKRFMERFAETSNAVFRIANWAKAAGHNEPFDTGKDDVIEKIMARGAVQAELVEDTYKDKVRMEVNAWKPFAGTEDPDWAAMISAGEVDFDKKSRELEEKHGGGGGGSSSGGSSSGGGGSTPPPDDDIPF